MLPFPNISFQNMGEEVHPRLTLGAYNACIMGITDFTTDDNEHDLTTVTTGISITSNECEPHTGTEFSLYVKNNTKLHT